VPGALLDVWGWRVAYRANWEGETDADGVREELVVGVGEGLALLPTNDDDTDGEGVGLALGLTVTVVETEDGMDADGFIVTVMEIDGDMLLVTVIL
jgi:hypothetical protein